MKNAVKIVVFFCLTVCVLLLAVSCDSVPKDPVETTSGNETTTVTTPDETTLEVTTPEETTPEETTPEVTTPEETTPEATTPEVTTPEEPPYKMPEKVDMDGYIYRAYVRSNAITGGPVMEDGNPAFYCEDFWVNPAQGEPEDVLEYAVYHRNQQIENDYNVKIVQVPQTINMVQELARYYVNGGQFDLTIILAKSAAGAATQNLLTELNSLPNLNLSHEAYDQNSIRELQMGGDLYYLSGDMNISTLDSVSSTVVNMDLYEDYAEAIVDEFDDNELYGNIYNVVKSGKWTIDTMLKIVAIASVDADPDDGVLGASEYDHVGYYQYNISAVYYFYGAGGRITKMNDEGNPEFVIGNDKNGELFGYIFDKLHPVNRNVRYPNGFSPDRKRLFVTNANTLFTDMTLWDVRKDLYVNATFDYGLL
ncbi:MAG: hypothetical protein IJV73_04120, partial [Clostridia bacterium]|nr:hypothetical protein [Clostridia bacterium]